MQEIFTKLDHKFDACERKFFGRDQNYRENMPKSCWGWLGMYARVLYRRKDKIPSQFFFLQFFGNVLFLWDESDIDMMIRVSVPDLSIRRKEIANRLLHFVAPYSLTMYSIKLFVRGPLYHMSHMNVREDHLLVEVFHFWILFFLFLVKSRLLNFDG